MRKKRLSKQQRPLWKRFVIMTGKVTGMLMLYVAAHILMLFFLWLIGGYIRILRGGVDPWEYYQFFKPIPSGYTEKEEHYDPNGFQDYTDYCKYRYASADPFRNDERYHAVTAEETKAIIGYFSDFEGWMRSADRYDEYDFDWRCVNEGDYVFIMSKEGRPIGQSYYGKYDNYTVYFFDTESMILYYIHNNI